MVEDYENTETFRGARFSGAVLAGARFHDCDLRNVKISDSRLVDVRMDGEVGNLLVNGVDVTAFVSDELDRRHPERVQLRAMHTADDYRAMWDTVDRIWSTALARAERLPEALRYERVDGEWSFAETLRHLVFATDAWAGSAVLGKAAPYHRLGLTHEPYPAEVAAGIGIDLQARPTFAEVLEARAGRLVLMRAVVDGLTDAELDRVSTRSPSPRHPKAERSVRRCLRVVMNEECEHHRYAVRDLAVLETRQG